MMWLAVVSPLTGHHAEELVQLWAPTFREYGFEFSVSFIMVNPRSFLALMEIFYDRDNPDEVQRGLGALRRIAGQEIEGSRSGQASSD